MNILGDDTNKQRRLTAKEAKEQNNEEVKLVAIDEDEQEVAEQIIGEMHPLKTTPPSVAFPILCCCMKMCKSANEVGELTPEEEQKLRDDIREQTQRLDTVIHFYKAPAYRGTSFEKEKLKAAGLTKGTTAGTTIEDLGFGILAWLGILKFMFFVYLAITVFAITMMSNYSSYGLLDPSGGVVTGFKGIGKTSMGSIGFQ